MTDHKDIPEDRARSPSDSSSISNPHDDIEKAAQDAVTQPGNELSRATSEPAYPSTKKVLVIMAGILLAQFLVALDRLIVGVAIPKITDEFHSLSDIGWYGSAYLLTACALMLFMGRVYTFYDPKWVYIGCIVLFEIGSAVCGAAPNTVALIVGRAIAGAGCAGLFGGAVIIIVHIIPLHKRPQYTGFMGLTFGVASALGPVLGGVFTDGPGWRWCFYINLPLGGVTLLLLIFVLHIDIERKPTTTKEKIQRLDPLGTFFFLPCMVCLLLALQWGGVTYNWSDGRIIALLVVAGVLFIFFLVDQKFKGQNATVPGHIFFNRSIIAGMWFTFTSGGSMLTLFYFIPIWFQAIKGASAVKAGVDTLPMVIGIVIASIGAGFLTRKVGYYTPWMYGASVIMPIAAGLISTWTPTTAHPAWIGYQAMFGLGTGLGMQQASVAAQTILSRKDVATGASLMMFCQTLGGAIWISVGNNIFDNQLAKGLATIPGIDIGAIAQAGATSIRTQVPVEVLPQVLVAYNEALRTVFYLATALASATIIGAVFMEWRSIKQGQQKKPVQAAGAGAGAGAGPVATAAAGAGDGSEKAKEQV